MGAEQAPIAYEGEHLTVARSAEGDRVVWRFIGEATSKVPDLKGVMDSLADRIGSEDAQVVIDVEGATHVSSPFIGLLVRLVARCADAGRVLELRGPSQRVMDLLSIVGRAKGMRIYGAGEALPPAGE